MKQKITPEEIGNKDETEWRINHVPNGWEHDGFFVEEDVLYQRIKHPRVKNVGKNTSKSFFVFK